MTDWLYLIDFKLGSFSTIEFKLNGLSDGVKECLIFNV
jgi:hypothetical protein